jgi:hypothetical protein
MFARVFRHLVLSIIAQSRIESSGSYSISQLDGNTPLLAERVWTNRDGGWERGSVGAREDRSETAEGRDSVGLELLGGMREILLALHCMALQ